ncbi:hypothetical protein ABH906_004161 [Pseudomonas frederiksbergensis]
MGRTIRWVQTFIRFVQPLTLIVPTLCVGMQPGTLCVPKADAERPLRHSHAERGNDHRVGTIIRRSV